MRVDLALAALTLFSSAAALATGQNAVISDEHELYKRQRGGGGGGGRGGGSGGNSGNSGNRGNSGNSGGSRPASTRPDSNSGGRTSGGSGTQPSFGNGRYYGGGAAVPYTSGNRSPGRRPIVPVLLLAPALVFWPGSWHHGAHIYEYEEEYTFFNETSNEEETLDIICGCAQYSVCSCEENTDEDYLDDLIGNGDYNELDNSVVNVGERDGEKVLLINGTLENGTTADSPASGSKRLMIENMGYWPAVAAVMAAVFLA
ncbi:hypothetical protein S7711_09770 [Stachybotrys chartarum IBT 7711]|uniref:DUF7732 domain-containing protein n=1 Tax=Stachybotrys chartarum (strain CBS 109288 / IBT 7711) TaxID=1280523 RepID=A0A084BAF8_STACB|nr:hypothetical protein S7711_09770 [Stachybotrys chartarum IBT 7711]